MGFSCGWRAVVLMTRETGVWAGEAWPGVARRGACRPVPARSRGLASSLTTTNKTTTRSSLHRTPHPHQLPTRTFISALLFTRQYLHPAWVYPGYTGKQAAVEGDPRASIAPEIIIILQARTATLILTQEVYSFSRHTFFYQSEGMFTLPGRREGRREISEMLTLRRNDRSTTATCHSLLPTGI